MNLITGPMLEWVRRNPKPAAAAGLVFLAVVLGGGFLLPAADVQALLRRKQQIQMTVDQATDAVRPARGSEFRELPSAEEAPELFKRFYKLAERYRVRVVEFSPRAVFPGTADQPAVLPIDLQMEAAYSDAGDFIGKLTEDPGMGIVSVRRIDMVPESENSGRLRLSVLVEFCLKTDGSR